MRRYRVAAYHGPQSIVMRTDEVETREEAVRILSQVNESREGAGCWVEHYHPYLEKWRELDTSQD